MADVWRQGIYRIRIENNKEIIRKGVVHSDQSCREDEYKEGKFFKWLLAIATFNNPTSEVEWEMDSSRIDREGEV